MITRFLYKSMIIKDLLNEIINIKQLEILGFNSLYIYIILFLSSLLIIFTICKYILTFLPKIKLVNTLSYFISSLMMTLFCYYNYSITNNSVFIDVSIIGNTFYGIGLILIMGFTLMSNRKNWHDFIIKYRLGKGAIKTIYVLWTYTFISLFFRMS